MRERRKFRRLKSQITCFYLLKTGFCSIMSETSVRDISRGGLSLLVDRIIVPRALVRIYVELPLCKAPMQLRCRVVWVKDFDSDYPAVKAAGVEFFPCGSRENTYLVECLDRLSASENITQKSLYTHSC